MSRSRISTTVDETLLSQARSVRPGTPDSIVFDAAAFGSPQTITLTSGEIALADAVTITGPTAKVTIDANKASRIFNVDVPGKSGQAISISAMTLTNGKLSSGNGGAILDNDEKRAMAM